MAEGAEQIQAPDVPGALQEGSIPVTGILGVLLSAALVGLGVQMLMRRSLRKSSWFLLLALLLPLNALFGIGCGLVDSFGRIVDNDRLGAADLAAGIIHAMVWHRWMLGLSLLIVPLAIVLYVIRRHHTKKAMPVLETEAKRQ